MRPLVYAAYVKTGFVVDISAVAFLHVCIIMCIIVYQFVQCVCARVVSISMYTVLCSIMFVLFSALSPLLLLQTCQHFDLYGQSMVADHNQHHSHQCSKLHD